MAYELILESSAEAPKCAPTSKVKRESAIQRVTIAGMDLEVTPVFEAYWRFAAERQNVFLRRVSGSNDSSPTTDPILQEYKFTNAYRASDRVSQYLIGNVIYDRTADYSFEDTFLRTMLFKFFNKIETWEALVEEFGQISAATFDPAKLDAFLTDRLESREILYSAAYIMPSAGRVFGKRYKHSNHLYLLDAMMKDNFSDRLAQLTTMEAGYELMMSAPSIGPFLAYQFITDLNYSPDLGFDEMEFVKAGPGALDGISKCFADVRGLDPSDVIKHFAQHQKSYFALFEINFSDLWGRELQLIDCQNLFCEISKYARVAFPDIAGVSGRTRIKQKFKSSGRPSLPWYPPKWGLNDRIGGAAPVRHYLGAGSHTANAVQYTLL